MPIPEERETSAAAAIAAAGTLRGLAPVHLAELRRMDGNAPAAAFWLLAARHPDTIGAHAGEGAWVDILRTLAILAPKGRVKDRPALHNPKRRLGAILCDGGSPNWPDGGEPRPAFSERRLARLLSAEGEQRAALLVHAARGLSGAVVAGGGVHVPDVAHALLHPIMGGRHVAEHYYRRLDGAMARQPKHGESP